MNDTTNKNDKAREKKVRQKSHDLGKLSAALGEAKGTIAKLADIPIDDVDLSPLAPSIAKATADIAAAVGVPPENVKLSAVLVL